MSPEGTRIPTSPTVEEDYGVEPLPPTPFVDRWTPQRVPWGRIVLVAVMARVATTLVMSALR